jgi:hypothetical protein
MVGRYVLPIEDERATEDKGLLLLERLESDLVERVWVWVWIWDSK